MGNWINHIGRKNGYRLRIAGKTIDSEKLQDRTKQFALQIIKLVDELPKTTVGKVIGGQLIRCGTSVGANYRAACRARSKAEFISKLGIVLEEADESGFWLEIIIEGNLLKIKRVTTLLNESHELVAIFTSFINSAKGK